MPPQYTLPPDTRSVGSGNPPADMNAVVDALIATGAGCNVLSAAFAGGADPTGAVLADSAFAAAKASAASTGYPMIIPPGTYSISAELDWSGDGLTVLGAGKNSTVIVQATANTPVAHVTGRWQSVSGLTLKYATQRASSETRAVALAMSSNAASCSGSHFSDLKLLNAQTAIDNHPDNTSSAQAFSCLFDNITIIGWSQSAVAFGSPIVSTGNCFSNIYASNGGNASASYPLDLSKLDESAWNQVNVESAVLTTNAIQLTSVGSMAFNSVHCEALTMNGNFTGIFGLPAGELTQVALAAVTVKLCTFAGSTWNSLLAFVGWGTSVDLRGFFAKSNTVTTPALYLAALGSTQNVSVTIAAADTSLFTALRTAGAAGDTVVDLALAESGQYLCAPAAYAPTTGQNMSTASSTLAAVTGAASTVAAGSNGGQISLVASWSSPSAGVLAVANGTVFPAAGGTVNVAASGATTAVVTYAGVSGNTLTGCAYVSGSPSGTVSTGGAVTLTSAAASTGSFTAPSSGKAVVTVTYVSFASAGINVAYALAAHGTVTPVVGNAITYSDATAGRPRLLEFLITGLTPGSSYNFDLLFATASGTETVAAAGITSTTPTGSVGAPVTMETRAV